MTSRESGNNSRSQADKFREAARELETDQSEENFDRIVKKVAKPSRPKESNHRAKKTDGGNS